jgi:hypothetical protein
MVVMMDALAPLILAMQPPTNAFILEQNVLITIFAPSTNVLMEFVTILKRRIVMMEMLVLLTLAVQLLVANTPLLIVMTTMHVLLILVTL